jgi:hypothetical protein
VVVGATLMAAAALLGSLAKADDRDASADASGGVAIAACTRADSTLEQINRPMRETIFAVPRNRCETPPC